jgi:hypothetical protein
MSKDDLEALIPIITDMASAVNESFKKEEDIMVTDECKLDMMGMQRYVNICIVERQFTSLASHEPISTRTMVLVTHHLCLILL